MQPAADDRNTPSPPPPAGSDPQGLLNEVRSGLAQTPKRLPTRLLYDEYGSQLFDRITELPEYYPTRLEISILTDHATEIADRIGPRCALVELGSGSSAKTRILLDHLHEPVCYVPVDISGDFLQSAARSLAADYPHIPIEPVCADFTKPFALPAAAEKGDRIAVFFPGSTIGNFLPDQAVGLLRRMREIAGADGCLIVGTDTCQDEMRLNGAYNDSAGVTAEFNRNLLPVLNRLVGADFAPDRFEHRAVFDPARRRVEMRLISTADQSVHLDGTPIRIAEGEPLVTEYSHKFLPTDVQRMAAEAGLQVACVWRDPDEVFAVQFLTPVVPS